jgi:hypothetical protein
MRVICTAAVLLGSVLLPGLSAAQPFALRWTGESSLSWSDSANWVDERLDNDFCGPNSNPFKACIIGPPTSSESAVLSGTGGVVNTRAVIGAGVAHFARITQILDGMRVEVDSMGQLSADSVFISAGADLTLVNGSVFSDHLSVEGNGTVILEDGFVNVDTLNTMRTFGSPSDAIGTISGHGSLTAAIGFTNKGILEARGGNLFVLGAGIDLDGDVALEEGELRVVSYLGVAPALTDPFDGKLFIERSGKAEFAGGFALGSSGVAELAGELRSNTGTPLAVFDPLYGRKQVRFWDVSGEVLLADRDRAKIVGPSTPRLDATSSLSGTGEFRSGLWAQGADISPDGELIVAFDNANSSEILSYAVIGDESELVFDLGETSDTISVDGTLVLGTLLDDGMGTLLPAGDPSQPSQAPKVSLRLKEGYVPIGGEVFPVIAAETLWGLFPTLDALPELPTGLRWLDDFGVLPDGRQAYFVGVAFTELNGDFNLDGVVDAADYTVWRDSGGTDVQRVIWEQNYGRSVVSQLNRVPEPSSIVTLLLALAAALLWSKQMA